MNEIIVILGGGLHQNQDGSWRTTTFNEGDIFGTDGSSARVIAGSILYHKNTLNKIIIASGGKGQYKQIYKSPNISKIIKQELIALGVNKEKIIEESKSNNTWQQLQEIKKIINSNNIKKIIIISNRYHLPRIKAMIAKDKKLDQSFKESILNLKSAESILIKYNPEKWIKIIKHSYQSKSMKSRIVLEKKGVKDIKSGVYKLK